MWIMRQFKTAIHSLKKYFSQQPTYKSLALAIGLMFVLLAAIIYVLTSSQKPNNNQSAKSSDSQVVLPETNNCASSNTRYQNTYKCYKNELTGIINQHNPESATAFLKQQYNTVGYVKSDCHQLMHIVGRAAYAKYGNLAQAFAHGDQYCWSGFYHGIMEQVSTEKGYDYIIKHAATICQPIAKQYGHESFNDYNCVHGLGHGFMEIEDENLFAALKSCDATGDDWNRSSCYGGVFMQNVMNVQGPEAKDLATYNYLKTDDPMYPCDAVDDKYQEQCYLMQTSFALQVDGYDFSKVFAQCAAINPTYVNTCYQSAGRDASGQSISDLQKTKATCLLTPDLNAQTNCTIGAVKDFVSYFHNDKQGYDLCAAMPANIAQTCNDTVKAYYSNF
jgi:hypothetical protein